MSNIKIKVNGTEISLENSKPVINNTPNLEEMSAALSKESEDLTKQMRAYALFSDVKTVESFGYKSTEGVGTYIKKGLKFIWENLKKLFKKIGDFFVGIYRQVKGFFAKLNKKNVQFVGRIAGNAIARLPDGNYRSEQFARLLLEAPEVKTAKNQIATAKKQNELGAAAEKIGGVTKIAENNFYVAGLIGYEPEQVVKICAPSSAYPATDGTPEKKDFIDEYRKATNLVYDGKTRQAAIDVAIDAQQAIKVEVMQGTTDRNRNVPFNTIKEGIDIVKPAIEKYEQPYQKVEGVKDAKAEFKKVCDMAANGGFDKIDAEDNRILEALKNFQNRLDEAIVLFDDIADQTADQSDKNRGDTAITEQRLDSGSKMNANLSTLKNYLMTDMKYFNLSINSLRRVIDAKVGIAMIVSKLASTVKYDDQKVVA